MRMALIAVAGLAATAPALGQDTAGCAKFKWSVARERTAFATPGLPEVANGGSLPGIMDPVSVKLEPQAGIAFEHTPGSKRTIEGAHAAVLKMAPIAVAGTYQVTLSDEAWIDVLQDGKEVRSAGFSGQPDCPGVRKSVKFPLKAGPVTVQISGARASSIKVDVLPVE